MLSAAADLLTLGPKAVLLKGGHLTVRMADIERVCGCRPGVRVIKDGILGTNMEILLVNERDPTSSDLVVDVLCEAGGVTTLIVGPRLESSSTHGTGCTLSAALICELAKGTSCEFSTYRPGFGLTYAVIPKWPARSAKRWPTRTKVLRLPSQLVKDMDR